MIRNLRLLPTLAALVIATAACSSSSDQSEGQPLVLATTSIWADVVTNLTCGELVDVVAIIPPGADPHGFEPSLADRGLIDNAALTVANGLGLEETLSDTLEAATESGALIIEVGAQIDPLRFDGSDIADPHFWFNPKLVADTLPWLAERISSTTELDASTVNECMTQYRDELLEVDQELEAIFDAIPQENRKLVTNHDSLGYLADQYGLEIVATVLGSESSLGQANSADLQRLVEQIEAEGVTAIFTEVQSSDDEAQAIAARLGQVSIVELNTGSLGPKDSSTDTYIGLLRTNAELIADGLN